MPGHVAFDPKKYIAILPNLKLILNRTNFFLYKPITEALKSKSEARFEISVKEQINLMVPTMSDYILAKSSFSSFSKVVFNDL